MGKFVTKYNKSLPSFVTKEFLKQGGIVDTLFTIILKQHGEVEKSLYIRAYRGGGGHL